MIFAEFALRNKTTTLVLTLLMVVGGIFAYQNLGRLEDPEFTIKEALVLTPYPGASAREVEEEVSDKIETAVQQLGQLKEVESRSVRGFSTVTVRIKDQYDKNALPQVWDELRRKVGDTQRKLPPGAGPSIVNDDYGDVWGIFVAIYGPEYSYAELKEVAKGLRKELLLVQDVAKIDFWGERTEVIYVEPNRERVSQLGLPPGILEDALRSRNVVADGGHVKVGPEYIAIQATGYFQTVEEIENLLLTDARSGRQIYLKDIADVRRGYQEPYDNILRYDGSTAIGLGISTVSGGNVVVMGDAVYERVQELLDQLPLGIEFGIISLQSQAVTEAIDGFLISLVEAVVIVVAVLLLFMGLRSGLLIGAILGITIAGTFIFMGPWGVLLERISLGALIIALGMLVDNAIVVVDGMLVRMEGGQEPEEAALEVVGQTSMPLLGATAVAVMAFASIGLSDDSTGEFCRSLFQVVFISLFLSWVTAVTVTPVLGVLFLKVDVKGESEGGDNQPVGGIFGAYRGFLARCLRLRWLTTAVVIALFGASIVAFGSIDKSFFPASTRPQFMVDFWLPQGTDIDDTVAAAAEAEEYIQGLDGVTHISSLIGAGGMRMLLTYAPEKANSAYAQFLVDVDDYQKIDGMIAELERELPLRNPDAEVFGKKFSLGPGYGGKLQLRFRGEDPDVLRELAAEAEAILYADGGAKAIRSDWRQQVKLVQPVVAAEEADLAGIRLSNIADTTKVAFQGEPVGVYREADELLPIVVRAPGPERSNVAEIQNLQIYSPAADQAIPFRQVISNFETSFENDIIARLNRKPTITIHADPVRGAASVVQERVREAIEAIPLAPGYDLQWWGESRDATRAQQGIAASLPFFGLAMLLIVVALFNDLRQPTAIFLCVPLALIGVSFGLLFTGQPFGFMALLGFMSLSGMLIKNAIVLVDEIELQKRSATSAIRAILDSGVSRLRPVSMAALTTALGMIPLIFDAFFVAMAVTVIAGLIVATVLTMIVLPVFYAILFRLPATED